MNATCISLPWAVLLYSLSMLAYQTRSFVVQTAVLTRAPHTVVRSSGLGARCRGEGQHCATSTVVDGNEETVVVKADVWEGFGEEDHMRFLDEYWQKKPLLIRQAVRGLDNLLSKDELAGLACCPDVESRVITGGKMVEEAGKDWEVEHGPFEEQIFSELGETHWTLLVNEVDRHVPEVSDLLSNFRFVPTWRVDDVMVSYAPEGGSVGPHVDNYDVFLLQGAGKRRWSIEETVTSGEEETTRSIDGIDVRVLSDFKEAQAWVLEPGDALYLPPRIAHHGVSQDNECMTYSVGFRAPSTRDLVTFFGDHVASTVANADAFYQDPDLQKQDNHGLIARDAVSRAKGMLREALMSALDDDVAFDSWFGSHVTRSRRDHSGYPMSMDDEDGLSFGYQFPEDVTAAVRRAFRREKEVGASPVSGDGIGPFVYHGEGLTFAFVEHQGDSGATLFVDGNGFPLPGKMAFLAGLVCKFPRLSPRELGPALEGAEGEGFAEVLHLLLREGYLYPADD